MIVALVLPPNASAQESNSSLAAQGTSGVKIDDVKAEAKPKKFGFDATLEGSSNFREAGDYESSREASYSFIPNYKITDKITASAEIVFVHNLKQAAESDFKNTTIGMSYSAINLAGESLTIKPIVSALLPSNKEARDTTSLLGGIGVGQSLAFKPAKLPVTLTYGASVRRNIHEYDHTNEGAANTMYSFSNSLKGYVDVTDKISFTTKATVFSGLTYLDSWRSKFEIFEELGYAVSDTYSIALGHVNTDATLKSDMTTSNVEFFNNNTSSIYLDLNVTY